MSNEAQKMFLVYNNVGVPIMESASNVSSNDSLIKAWQYLAMTKLKPFDEDASTKDMTRKGFYVQEGYFNPGQVVLEEKS